MVRIGWGGGEGDEVALSCNGNPGVRKTSIIFHR